MIKAEWVFGVDPNFSKSFQIMWISNLLMYETLLMIQRLVDS
jgi:hypothetical protein